MPSPSRRRVLRWTLAVLAFLVGSGCVAPPQSSVDAASSTAPADSPAPTATPVDTPTPPPTPADTPAPTPSDPGTSPPAERIAVVIQNETSATRSVSLSITRGDAVLFEGTVRVRSGEYRWVAPGIDRTGEYTVRVDVAGGPGESAGLPVEEYDLRMGSNLIAIVDDEGIGFLLEE